MPTLIIKTNAPLADDQAGALLRAASTTVSQVLGKSEAYVMAIHEHNARMLFGGSDAPTAYLELKSIGFPRERAAEVSATLCALITRHLGIPAARIYIEFADADRKLWGWNGRTF